MQADPEGQWGLGSVPGQSGTHCTERTPGCTRDPGPFPVQNEPPESQRGPIPSSPARPGPAQMVKPCPGCHGSSRSLPAAGPGHGPAPAQPQLQPRPRHRPARLHRPGATGAPGAAQLPGAPGAPGAPESREHRRYREHREHREHTRSTGSPGSTGVPGTPRAPESREHREHRGQREHREHRGYRRYRGSRAMICGRKARPAAEQLRAPSDGAGGSRRPGRALKKMGEFGGNRAGALSGLCQRGPGGISVPGRVPLAGWRPPWQRWVPGTERSPGTEECPW